MSNEMGNQSASGLQVSEQDTEVTEVSSQSPYGSLVSNNFDGLKGLTGYLSDSSRTTEKLATSEYLEPKVDTDKSVSSRENDEEEHSKKFSTDEPSKSSNVATDALDQSQSVPSRDYEDENKKDTDESLDSSIVSNEEHTYSAQNEFSELDSILVQKRTYQGPVSEQENDKSSNNRKALATSSSIDGSTDSAHCLLYDPQTSEEHEAEKLNDREYVEHVDASNDVKEGSPLILSREYDGVQYEKTHLADNETLETDDSLIQKQMTEERATEKPENKKLATSEYLEPTVDLDKSVSSSENEEEERSMKFSTEEPSKSSIVSNDGLDQSHSIPSRDYKAFRKNDENKKDNDESLDSSIVSSEEHTCSAQNEFSELDSTLVQKRTSEGQVSEQENDGPSNNRKALDTSSSIDGLTDSAHVLPYDPQTSEEHEVEKLDVREHVNASNDVKEGCLLILSREYGGVQDENTDLAHNEALETDDSLIQKQMTEEREDEVNISAQKSTDKDGQRKDLIIERQNECVTANTNQENNIEELPDEDISSRGGMVVTNSSEVVEGSNDQDGDRQCEVDALGNDFGPLQLENRLSNVPIHTVYLDVTDNEIKKLIMEDDANEVNKASQTESNGYGARSNKSLEEESTMDDIDIDSFEIQLNLCEKEMEKGEDCGLEEAVFEIAIQTAYNPNLISEKQRKDLEGVTETLEMETDKIEDISAAGNKPELITKNETEGLEKNEIIGENYSQLSYLSDSAVVMVMEKEDSETEEIALVNDVSERKTIQLENAEIMEKRTEDLNVMGSSVDEENGQKVKVVTKFEEKTVQIIPTEITPDLLKYIKEFEKECMSNEYESPTSKEGSITVVLNEDCSIFSGSQNLTENTFLSAFESDGGGQMQDSVTPLGQQTMIQNKEVECVQLDRATVCVSPTDPKILGDSGSFSIELCPEKFKTNEDNALGTVKCHIYTSERSELETKESSPSYSSLPEHGADESDQIPSANYDKATKDEVFSSGTSVTEDNVREYHVSTNQISTVGAHTSVSVLGSTYEESDKSPLLSGKAEGSDLSATELSNSGKLRAPLVNHLKEKVPVADSVGENDGIVLKKTVEKLWQSPVKKSIVSSARGREKQKPRSSLFSSCMCCTTAIS